MSDISSVSPHLELLPPLPKQILKIKTKGIISHGAWDGTLLMDNSCGWHLTHK